MCTFCNSILYGFLFLDSAKYGPWGPKYSASLGTSEELPSGYAMKTAMEQGTLSEQPVVRGAYVARALFIVRTQ